MGLFHGPRAYPEYYERYYDMFNIYDGRKAWEASIKDIPPAAVHLWSLHWLHLEVYNGGFMQFFWNSTGVLAPEARDGFLAIGMPEVAEVVQGAMDKIGRPYLFEKEEREQLFMSETNPDELEFNKEDISFYEIADTKKFFRRVPKFVPYADAYAMAHLDLG